VGIDSYSYHRRYGEIRWREVVPAAGPPWPFDPQPVLEHARSLAVDDIFLETCYLPEPEAMTEETLAPAGRVRVGFSWGHPWPEGAFHGLDGGRTPAAEDHLARWIACAARLGHPVMRITLGSPASRGTEPAAVLVDRLIAPTRRAAERAGEVGLALAIENHGDLRAQDVLEVIERVGLPNLGVTLDNVNLIRVGDDMLEGTRALAPRTLLVQLKDHPPTPDPTIRGGALSVALGEGVAPLDEIVAILAASGFDGPVCVELASLGGQDVDELAMIERSVRWLRGHLPGVATLRST
jgi:sugar phosphate isomerase/epimerase